MLHGLLAFLQTRSTNEENLENPEGVATSPYGQSRGLIPNNPLNIQNRLRPAGWVSLESRQKYGVCI